ncbi:AfsR/SARP family transcriptional regulator [Actinokineospora terrae]|uniref:AfsR/SARP family transcriptional regulator n=1 Tax=Actinokineospora terrae TaxID=155974 RepID=UPI000B89A60C|nr:AfsR/SARP family transcriptional regulator [Actinokineospora terrae]
MCRGGRLDVRVLGPLSLRRDGEDLLRVAGKPRQLLALLLLNEPHRVSTGSLVTELWDDLPPRSVTTTLQTHVFALRGEFARTLGVPREQVARDLLQTRDGGYRFDLGGASFDLTEFHRLRASGQALVAAGDALGAGRVLSAALHLWQGPALLDIDHGRLLRACVAELDKSRVDTLVLLLGTRLRLGAHREVLSELARLVVRHPHHEELHAQFMVALYRSGYRTRALEVFDELRRDLRDELGVAPSPRVSRLWQLMRVADTEAVDATGGYETPLGQQGR